MSLAEADSRGRREQLAEALAAVQQRIALTCQQVGRDPEKVTLVVVTKRFPASDLAHLVSLGVTEIGENRDQEIRAKLDELAEIDPRARAALRVHMIGQVQTNKAASVVSYADVVHSVDRERLVAALSRAAEQQRREVELLVQINLDGAKGRGGVAPDQVMALAQSVVAAPGLRLRGVMSVAPLGADPGAAFATVAHLAQQMRREWPEASVMSAGMSHDLEEALAHGATHLRVGSAILGSRSQTR
ncbi:Pyridoxal phosphate homeostasis protein [Austwickia sp. TVS 96-490-7B]|uniref:YggS family pyridoxal phosphate-dependent enzyme n=1 Tax=Austwickia sp. TVS 96-490-7B TaxID=2830843 RepID=UPI001C55CF3C|nr:YggS family pyridoxal phosphate-dependent enzyme [Austwickia sp. TVS 96-490-7B]MBW3084398.1 Pyridoxal phosphate homeostasis protein [Austwickia sp. TVS 96-490-7B]